MEILLWKRQDLARDSCIINEHIDTTVGIPEEVSEFKEWNDISFL